MVQSAERAGMSVPTPPAFTHYEEMKSKFPYGERTEITPNLALLLNGRVLIDCWGVRVGHIRLDITSDYDYTAVRGTRLVPIRNLYPGTPTKTAIDLHTGGRIIILVGDHYWIRLRAATHSVASLVVRSAIIPFSLRTIQKDESYDDFFEAFMNQNFPPKPK